jgi:hypothetical protein
VVTRNLAYLYIALINGVQPAYGGISPKLGGIQNDDPGWARPPTSWRSSEWAILLPVAVMLGVAYLCVVGIANKGQCRGLVRSSAYPRISCLPSCLRCVVTAFDGCAQVSNKSPQSNAAWTLMDNCNCQAWKQHPDYSNEDKAKRDQAAKQFLPANNLPPVASRRPAVSSGSRHQRSGSALVPRPDLGPLQGGAQCEEISSDD